jgi:hypothetical protein
MTDDKQMREDLSYVRSTLDRARAANNPAIIYFLWAAITFFGFAIIDYAPERTGFYWMIMGPLGGVLSGVLGSRAGRALGQDSRREGRLQGLHWGGMMVAILLLIPLMTTRTVSVDELPRIILLLVALSYYLAGVHVDRRLLWVGAAMGGCYLFTVYQRGLPRLWTITAAALAASLVAAGIVAAARARREA